MNIIRDISKGSKTSVNISNNTKVFLSSKASFHRCHTPVSQSNHTINLLNPPPLFI